LRAARTVRLSPESRREVLRLARVGVSSQQIVRETLVSSSQVGAVLRPLGGRIRSSDLDGPGGRVLRVDDRIEILEGIHAGESLRVIGARIGRPASTVCREINTNGGRDSYEPVPAQRAAAVRRRRPKRTKLAASPELCERVVAGLERLWSPQQISADLRERFGNDKSMQVSHETIYQSLYVQGRGELRRELAACLRSGRAARKAQGRLGNVGRIAGMVNISERPPDIEDRAVPGHWEGDLIMGSLNRSAIGTLVERSTRYVMLLHLPGGSDAHLVAEAMAAKISTLPASLRRSITWDQGHEMAHHATFTIATGVPVYFCDPHSPWQRGSNENTNGLLRQYFPKGTDLSVHEEATLDAAADSLNTRPRQTLAWQTPAQRLAALVAATP
jgi:IS30 family transposase